MIRSDIISPNCWLASATFGFRRNRLNIKESKKKLTINFHCFTSADRVPSQFTTDGFISSYNIKIAVHLKQNLTISMQERHVYTVRFWTTFRQTFVIFVFCMSVKMGISADHTYCKSIVFWFLRNYWSWNLKLSIF